jgi:hypothetical protein
MKFSVSTKSDDIKDSGGGGYINQSGIYDVTLNYVQLAPTKNKAQQLNFNVANNGTDQTIFGPILVNTNGELNDITRGLLNRLCIVVGMDNDYALETETAEYPVGKEQKLTEMEVFPDLESIDVKMRVQMEYSRYNGVIQERKSIKAFYREDGATASEATSGDDIGKRLGIDQEKYASNVTYKDGLTEEDVKNWIQSRMDSSSAGASSAPAPKAAAQRPRFGQKG